MIGCADRGVDGSPTNVCFCIGSARGPTTALGHNQSSNASTGADSDRSRQAIPYPRGVKDSIIAWASWSWVKGLATRGANLISGSSPAKRG
jgi:hypothetical protein